MKMSGHDKSVIGRPAEKRIESLSRYLNRKRVLNGEVKGFSGVSTKILPDGTARERSFCVVRALHKGKVYLVNTLNEISRTRSDCS